MLKSSLSWWLPKDFRFRLLVRLIFEPWISEIGIHVPGAYTSKYPWGDCLHCLSLCIRNCNTIIGVDLQFRRGACLNWHYFAPFASLLCRRPKTLPENANVLLSYRIVPLDDVRASWTPKLWDHRLSVLVLLRPTTIVRYCVGQRVS